jgi:hypothetical protein
MNRSFKYDIPEEMIGFIDTTLILDPDMFEYLPPDTLPEPDSISVDSLDLSLQDSLDLALADTVIEEISDSVMLAELGKYSVYLDIFLFQEDNKTQYLADYARDDRRKLSLYFNRALTREVSLEPYNFEPAGEWHLLEEHVMQDTLDYWLLDSMVYQKDSLQFLAEYPFTDSLDQLIIYHDTLDFNYREPTKTTVRKRRQEQVEEETAEQISLSTSVAGNQPQDIYRPLTIEIQHPVSGTDQSRIVLSRQEDTLNVPVSYSLEKDSTHLRRYFLNADWESDISYTLDIFPGAFTDIYDLTHDTISSRFNTRDADWYGRILLNVSGVDGPKIVQILDKDDNVIREKAIRENGSVEFPFLEPAGFTLKIIHDDNGNGQWDTGSYLEKRQPERVSYQPGTINIRSNFDMEIKWDLSEEEK